MAKYEIPLFMKGTTAWSFLGYAYVEQPPIDLLGPSALDSENPWIVLASVLEHAKKGNFDYLHRLPTWFHSGNGQGPDRACVHLSADAGCQTDLDKLQVLLEDGPDELRAYAAEAAVFVGRLWLVPAMLDAWKRVSSQGHHDTIGFAISSILESPGGAIAEEAGLYNIDPNVFQRLENPEAKDLAQRMGAEDPEVTEFEARVRERLSKLRSEFGNEVSLWQGRPFNVRALAEQMYALVRSPSSGPLHGHFIQMRHKLEAVTGIDCSNCYKRGVLQPLAASAFLEAILDGELLSQYESGVRYFFGHRIPG